MTKQEILSRIWNVLNQGVDTRSNDLDLLRYDLEMENWNLRVGSEISISISSKVNSIIKINEVLEPLA